MPSVNEIKYRRDELFARSISANYNVLADDINTVFHNASASGAITATLPQALPNRGPFYFLCASAHSFTVIPGTATDTIRGKAAGASIAASTVPFLLKLFCAVTGFWEVEVNVGPWA